MSFCFHLLRNRDQRHKSVTRREGRWKILNLALSILGTTPSPVSTTFFLKLAV